MLGSGSEHSTPKEQIKNIIDNNSHEAQTSEEAAARLPQKPARKRLL